jgi:hypothetical protein
VLEPNRRGSRQKKTPFRSTMNQKDVIVLQAESRTWRRRCQPGTTLLPIGSCCRDVKIDQIPYDLWLGVRLGLKGITDRLSLEEEKHDETKISPPPARSPVKVLWKEFLEPLNCTEIELAKSSAFQFGGLIR